MSPARGAACGKVILLGEHAVVHGTPAIASGIEHGAEATAEPSTDGRSTLLLGAAEHIAGDTGGDLCRAFGALLAELPGTPPLRVTAESRLLPGGGLGSSAALAVSIARAVRAFDGGVHAIDDARILAAASAWERVFHGNPSGIDTTAAALGGCFLYTRAEGASPLALRRDVWLAIGSTGTSGSTRLMVESVARLFERKPDVKDQTLPAITALVRNAALALEAGDLQGLGRLMVLNQMLLAGLLVSTEDLERMCNLARDAGALGAKLTGAGGGGSMIALLDAHDEDQAERAAARVLGAWRSAGYDGLLARISAQPRPASTGQPSPAAPPVTEDPE
ncbi:mevalonate kinase [Chondromyces crocatus]|uniref:mevalonate kinase n=1 Tax=Chondromyces crocatus TaxID=52 RepID=A0A0K1EH56_CHOCO|nr:mevalonate kinase [Chondromyces crocatus]AKT39928.1 uncharacterized protein CMC5_040790 [Chondromyces crocatus]